MIRDEEESNIPHRCDKVEMCIKCGSERRVIHFKNRYYYEKKNYEGDFFDPDDLPGYTILKIFSKICNHEWIIKKNKGEKLCLKTKKKRKNQVSTRESRA